MIGIKSRDPKSAIRVVNNHRLSHLDTHKQWIIKLQNRPKIKAQSNLTKKMKMRSEDKPGDIVEELGFWWGG